MSRPSPLTSASCVALSLLLAASPALAVDLDGARAAAARAEQAIGAELWCAAVGELVTAYTLSENGGALFNAAVAAQKGEHLSLARGIYRRLAEKKDDPLAAKAAEAAAGIDEQLKRGEPDVPCDAKLPEAAPVVAAAPEPAPAAPPEAVAPPPESSLSGRQIAGWALVGTGAVALVVGGVMLASAAGTRDELEAAAGGTPPPVYDAAAADDLASFQTSNTIGSAGLIGGLVLAAGGGALLLLSGSEAE